MLYLHGLEIRNAGTGYQGHKERKRWRAITEDEKMREDKWRIMKVSIVYYLFLYKLPF